jgi:putative nucleotidyltransferase with HDIG domain
MNPVPTKKQERYLKRIQAYITRMPSLSTTVIKVLETCNDSRASANDLHRIISFDPVLTARVLKLINSAYYSLGVPITSLTRAIVMLGLNTVKNLALSFAILENLRSNGHFSVFSPDDFWTHSLCVGVIAKSLASVIGHTPQGLEAFFVAGLLHDLGKIPLNRQFPEEYHQAWETAEKDQDTLRHYESKLLGMDHCTVGCMIAKKWRLGSTLVETLLHHHNPDDSSEADRDFVFIISLANQFADCLRIGNAGDCVTSNQEIEYLNGKVGANWTMLYEMSENVLDEIEKAKIFLEIARKD